MIWHEWPPPVRAGFIESTFALTVEALKDAMGINYGGPGWYFDNMRPNSMFINWITNFKRPNPYPSEVFGVSFRITEYIPGTEQYTEDSAAEFMRLPNFESPARCDSMRDMCERMVGCQCVYSPPKWFACLEGESAGFTTIHEMLGAYGRRTNSSRA